MLTTKKKADNLVNLENQLRPSRMPSIKTIQMVGYVVMHQTPWYIRLKVDRLGAEPDYAQRLLGLATEITGVCQVRINQGAKSIAVEFAPQFSAKQIAIAQSTLFTTLTQAVDVAAIVESKSAPVEEINYWQRLGLPALGLALGLGSIFGLPIPGVVMAGVMLAATIPVFQRAAAGILQEQQLNIDFLDGLAIALHTSHGSYFPPALMLGLIEGGEVIRDMTARGSQRASLDLLDCLNGEVLVERDGQELRIAAKDIVQGDQVILYPGDQIPVDGYIVRGTALVDQCSLTGESVPVARSAGEEVFASTLVVDGHLYIFAERLGTNTRAGVILSLVESAPVHDTRVENYAAVVANQLVVPTLVAAAVVGVLSNDLNRAIALLTLDIGTGIRISVPTTILSALTYAARNGVLIRSGRAIEFLAKIDTVVFDKTGTLTQGHAGITAVKVLHPQLSESEILAFAATAEQGLTHPIAEAIVRHAREGNLPLYDCDAWEYRVGLGVIAIVNEMQLLVGSQRLMQQEAVNLNNLYHKYPEVQSGSHSPVYVAGNGELLGVILYSDPLRPESQIVIQELRDLGIKAYMLSGDVARVAKAVAEEVEIDPDCVYAEAFPERKVEVVKTLHNSGKTVAFCGDGINDSAALAYADVSISFAGATDIARETADVVLMEDDLRGLILAIQVARQAMDIIWQNTAIVAIPNLGAMLGGVLFALDPVLAIVINNGSAILAEFNGLRPLLSPNRTLPILDSGSPQKVMKQNLSIASQNSSIADNGNRSLQSPLNQQDLAQRLGVTIRTVSRHRVTTKFNQWSQSKDPEGIAWHHHTDSQLFHPLVPL
jgi:heavy metal translocating P-type ATPase